MRSGRMPMIRAARCARCGSGRSYTTVRDGPPLSRAVTKASIAGRRASARQESARAFGIADPATQPVDDDQFDLTRAAHEPGGRVDVEARGQEVGQHPGPGRRRGYEPEGAGVVQAQREREDIARGRSEPPRPAVPPRAEPPCNCFSSSCWKSPSQALSPGSFSIRSTRISAALRARSSIFGRHLETSPREFSGQMPSLF